MTRRLQVIDRFYPAGDLRAEFDAKFADPRKASRDRFVWDYWHVPNQYTALRTPAWEYFSKGPYEAWHTALVQWGRRVLGCHDISPPWLSVYVEGCGQRLHGDLPHGPFAFVYSLTNWRGRKFSGGETLLLRDEVLDFWSDFVSERSVEQGELVETVPALQGRLVVFDPRIPHGVTTVRGVSDPREGRVVLHGWFVNPRPFIEGPVSVARVQAHLDAMEPHVMAAVAEAPLVGLVSLGVQVARSGEVTAVRVLSDTTRVPRHLEAARRRAVRRLVAHVRTWQLGKATRPSTLTLPLVFSA